MSVAFSKGQVTGPGDLKISVRNSSGYLVDPFAITYSVFDFTTGEEVLFGNPNNIPQSTGVGEFYAALTIPLDANIGDWVVRWNFKETAASPILQAIQNFNVVANTTVTSKKGFQKPQLPFLDELIKRLRISLRDNNPDRNYRFRPPSTEKFLQTQTEVFGYIWEDEELYYYLLDTVYDFNSAPPATDITLDNLPNNWSSAVIVGAGARACRALAMNWIADEFSVGGQEKVTLYVGGISFTFSLEEIYSVLQPEIPGVQTTVEPWQRDFVLEAFLEGKLEVMSCDPMTGVMRRSKVLDVLKHRIPQKRNVRVMLGDIGITVSEDHSLFLFDEGGPKEVLAGGLQEGDLLATCLDGSLRGLPVSKVLEVPSEEFMYDLSVPGDQNFVMANGILAHNTYSISGVSLDIDKSSKYMSMKENLENSYQKMKEEAKSTIKVVKGLKQPRFGVGVTAAMGPYSRVGVQSRRNYVGGGGYWM